MTTEPGVLPRIHRLPPLLADQIAAGEVVERPASVVKELVENALDAGATRVSIEIRRGGIEFIRVTDDGHGIHPDDLALALDRHATSKLRTAEDLEAIRTLGFRGEALPSIASVARLRMASCIAGETMGRELETAPGVAAVLRPVAHPVGTTVDVAALFHGVPARRRFLRSEQTEALHVLDTARRLALSRDDIRLQLLHDGRRVLDVPGGGDVRRRLREVIGKTLERDAVPIDYAAGGMTLTGWLCDPATHRSQTDHQYFYLNGRVVRDRQLGHAVRMAFAERIPPGRHGAYVLHLRLDAAAADVNVHPTKHEVRFRHARDVHDFLVASLRDALERMTAGRAVAEPAGTWRAVATAPPVPAPSWRSRAAETTGASGVAPGFLLHGRYLATERDGALRLADALEVCRRGFIARLGMARQGGNVPRRPLLVPVTVEVTAAQAAQLASRAAELARWGWVLVCTGPTGISLREFPLALADWPLVPLVRALADTGPDTAVPLPLRVARVFPESLPAELGCATLVVLATELGGECPWRTVDAAELERLFPESPGHG